MVTSEVQGDPRGAAVGVAVPDPEPRRLSPFLYIGLIFAALLGAGAVSAFLGVGPGIAMVFLVPFMGLTALFLLIGFFHALFSSRAKGAGRALAVLVLLGLGMTALVFTRIVESPHSGPSSPFPLLERKLTWPLAILKHAPHTGAEERFFTPARRAWIAKHCGIHPDDLSRLELRRGQDPSILEVAVPESVASTERLRIELHHLLRMLVLAAEEFQLDPNASVSSSVVSRFSPRPGFQAQVAADPPPSK